MKSLLQDHEKGFGSRLQIQRFHSISRIPDRRLFASYGTPEFAERRALIKRYAKIQRFLSNLGRTRPLLNQLNAQLMAQPMRSLSQILRAAEEGAPGPELRQLVVGLSTDDFSSLISEGITFEDWVSQTHRVQTHRIQWWMIRRAFDDADVLYSMSVDPTLSPNGRFGNTMWDLIVDSGHASSKWDFTKPETLQTYLRDRYRPFSRSLTSWFKRTRAQNQLGDSIRDEEGGFEATKGEFNASRPEMRQADEPGRVETKEGIWSGWKSAVEYGAEGKQQRVWRPTILIPPPPTNDDGLL